MCKLNTLFQAYPVQKLGTKLVKKFNLLNSQEKAEAGKKEKSSF